ncbi:hypothetical protein B0H17DRAFT_1062865, partial [Mycena rosella]
MHAPRRATASPPCHRERKRARRPLRLQGHPAPVADPGARAYRLGASRTLFPQPHRERQRAHPPARPPCAQ